MVLPANWIPRRHVITSGEPKEERSFWRDVRKIQYLIPVMVSQFSPSVHLSEMMEIHGNTMKYLWTNRCFVWSRIT
jgi:hypothetical protein